MMKKLLLSTLMLFVSICGFAYDCEVDGIYYNLNTTNHRASVTYKSDSNKGYSGIVHIPEEIEYNGTTYSVTSIDDYAFDRCYSVTELTIGNNVTSIGEYAFYYCGDGLKELTIPNSVTSIGNHAFYGCSGLTELTIGNSVASIGNDAFSGCRGLEKIVVDGGNRYYDSREECNAVIRKNGNVLVVGCKNTLIPKSVVSIGAFAFNGCRGLTELTIPNNVTSIGDCAFYNCSGLTKLTIPTSVTSIGNEAFRNCTGLTELTIGNGVRSIGYYTFNGCSGLTSIISLNTTPPTFNVTRYGSVAFDDIVQQNATLHVPAGCKEAYQHANEWENFVNIQDDASTDMKSVSTDKQNMNSFYTLDGVKLNTTNLSDLPAGIYIVNGKKVLVK